MRSETFSESRYVVSHEVNTTGIRLDAFLKERYRKRSREQLKRTIDSGFVSVQRTQGRHVTVGKLKPSTQLLVGDQVLVVSERKPEPVVSFDYRVLYEDEAIYVIDKPPNLPVHPAGRYFFNTLLTHLRTTLGTKRDSRSDFFLVHRIDKETSGLLVLAKTKDACTNLTRQFAEREIQKKYLAVVRGAPAEAEFEVDLAMKRASRSKIDLKMMVAPEAEGGQAALTRFRVLSSHRGARGTFSLVECFPKSGRQHQIRVHLEAAGYPIVGDKLYGMPEDEALQYYERRHLSPEAEARLVLPRQALHAAEIRFAHPTDGREMRFEAGLPPDLRDFLASLATVSR